MVQVTEYVDAHDRRPFGRWFDRLDGPAAAKVTAALDRMERGILSNTKGVGAGVWEYRIDAGPGYRI
ncbi:MAG: type II toxin-antitoxin system RelE/ParE family toxin, partial [Gammaproteobacteria bacterium]|nr:type II toxin-antitoxin system RelE/ParE family toxin [Gammaproteobacteria bacterium]